MTPRNNKRPTTGAPGVKLLISVSAMAAALGGWAMLSHKEPQVLADAPVPTQAATATAQPTSAPAYLDYSFEAIPTLEPVATLILPTDAPTALPGSKPVVIYITPTPAAAQVVQAPSLRVVDAPPPPPPSQPQSQSDQGSQSQPSNNSAPPPAPVTNTQSSQG